MKAKSKVKRIPAPIGGWNTRDPLESMKITDAYKLENWIPAPGGVRLREGYADHVTGISSKIQTLMEYAPPSGTNVLFAAKSTDIYNVTSAGAVGAAVVSTMTTGYWSHTMIGTSAGSYLWICNGSDAPRHYDGSAWATPVISGSGLTVANLIHVSLHKQRLWCVEKNTLNAWYLGTASIAGTFTKFALGSIAKKGGSLLATGSWTRDGGAGPDDYWVAVTDKGEVIVYQGTDPTSATTWGLVGVYSIPEPIGRRCLYKLGADLAVLTKRGVIPLSEVLGVASSGQVNRTLTNKITPTFEVAARAFGDLTDWQIIEFPKQKLLIVNVPTSASTAEQFVMQAETLGWCQFVNIDAACWSLLGDDLYIGMMDGTVSKFGDLFTDDGSLIVGRVIGAFDNFGSFNEKSFRMARPSSQAPEGFSPRVYVKTNYDTSDPPLNVVAVNDTGTAWDAGDWDEEFWGVNLDGRSKWRAVSGLGHVGAVAFAVQADVQIVMNGVDIMYEDGSFL